MTKIDIEERLQAVKETNTKLKSTAPKICGRCGTAAVTLECSPGGYLKEPIITATCKKCGVSSKKFTGCCWNKITGKFEHRGIEEAIHLALNEICGNGNDAKADKAYTSVYK